MGDGMYDKAADGSGTERLLMKLDGNGSVTDWSSDGRFIAYRRTSPQNAADVWIVPTNATEKPFALLQSSFDEDNLAFSPDVHWIAYDSDESGEKQVYIQPFPATGAKYQLSSGGGTRPSWRADGQEIFFISPDSYVMAAKVSTAHGYQAGVPVSLFESGIATQSGRSRMYAVTKDGHRFLTAVPRQRSDPTPLTVMVNWTEALKAQ